MVTTTKNKFKFVFAEKHDTPNVSLGIAFERAGSAYENSEKQGLGWLVSLAIREGSGNNDAKEFAENLASRGIKLCFLDDLENFYVFLETPSENLEEAISLMSDAIIYPSVDSEGFNRALEAIKSDFKHIMQNNFSTAIYELDRLMFGKHPYAKHAYTTLDTITNITRDDVLTYIKHNFAKDNMRISVVGDTKKERIAELLDKYLNSLSSKRSQVEPIPMKNDFCLSSSKHIFMDTPQTVVLFGQKGPSCHDQSYYNTIVLIETLGGLQGLNSVLTRHLRGDLGITHRAYFSLVNKPHGNIIRGIVTTDNSTADEAVSAVKDMLRRVKNEGIDEQRFKDAKVSLINSYILSRIDNVATLIELNNVQVNNLGVNYRKNFIKNINNVKLEEANELAHSLLDPDNLFIVQVGGSVKE